jgi:hypothetical protein
VQFPIGAVLQHSNTPLLRVAGFEDEDDDKDENEAPHEGGRTVLRREIAELKHRTNHLPPRQGGSVISTNPGFRRPDALRIRRRGEAGKRAEPWFTLGHGSARLEAQHTKGCGASFALRTPFRSFGSLAPPIFSRPCHNLLSAIGYWLLAISAKRYPLAPPLGRGGDYVEAVGRSCLCLRFFLQITSL